MFEIGVLVASGLLNGLLGFIVYTKNPKSATNKLFALLCASFITWSTVNYLSLHPVILTQFTWIRLVMFFSAFLCLSAYLTLTTFPYHELRGSLRARFVAVICTSIVMLLTLTPAVFKDLAINGSQISPVPNFGIVFFLLLVVVLLGRGIWSLVTRYRKSIGLQKAQLGLVLFGLMGVFTLILLANVVFVLLFHNSSLVSLGPAYTLVFSGAFYYAIVRRKLFDIRATAARLIAYVMSLGLVGGAYGALILVLSSLIPAQEVFLQRTIYVAFAMATALLYSPARRFFSQITSRVFYQDAYDAQQLFNALNKVLVANIELENLLTKASDLLSSTLKAEFCAVLLDGPGTTNRIVGTVKRHLKPEEWATIRAEKLFEKVSEQVIVADLLSDDGNTEILRVLRRNDIAAIARLPGGAASNQKELGLIIFGPKKSGGSYNGQDTEIIEAIANEMVIAIENALRFEEIQNFNITLQDEVSNATQKLKHQNKRLEELDNIKDDFISMASHQLRTPLTSVKGYLSMVLEGDAGTINRMQSQMLKQAFASSQRMVFLITDLLNVSRLKTGKFVIDAAPARLDEIVAQELEQLHETAQAKNITFTYDRPTEFPELMLDEVKIRQVIMNFVDNAIYYTPDGGRVQVELTEKPHTVELSVTDNGIGVPKSEQHHLFTKFYRAANARKARPDGTGLGLFMAQKVILAQGGSVIFSSVENKGSTFGFTFSKSRLAIKNPAPDATAATAKPVSKAAAR